MYNKVTLDSRPMVITIPGAAVKPTIQQRSGKPAGISKGRGGGRTGKSGNRSKPAKPTAEQLDKEMEAYLASGAATE